MKPIIHRQSKIINPKIDGGEELDAEELKKRTKDFAHRCVKLTIALPLFNEAHELASIFITSRRTAQIREQDDKQR